MRGERSVSYGALVGTLSNNGRKFPTTRPSGEVADNETSDYKVKLYLVLVCFSLFTHSRGLLAWPTGVRKKHGHPSSRALHLTLPLEGAALPAPVEEDILAFLASLEWELAVVRLEGVKDARTPLHVEFRGAVAL